MDIPFLKKEEKKERDCPICHAACELHPEMRKQFSMEKEFIADLQALKDKFAERGLKSFVITFSIIIPIDNDAEHNLNGDGYMANFPPSWAHLKKHKFVLNRARERLMLPPLPGTMPPKMGDFEVF